jgi:probable phosphoglycerate mutase
MPQLGATRIIAVRHGETAWNHDTRIQGHTDVGLNDRGLWQAQRVGEALAHEPIARVYSSDLSRAHATAQAIAQHNAALSEGVPHIHTGLRERHFGMFEGQTHADIATQWPDLHHRWRMRDPHFAPEGGESLVQLRERVLNTVNALASQHLGALIVLVAHGGVMDALYRLATGQEIEAPRTWALNNAAINRLLWTPDALTLVGWADTHHLDDQSQDLMNLAAGLN